MMSRPAVKRYAARSRSGSARSRLTAPVPLGASIRAKSVAEVARDQRRAVQEREHLIEPADRVGLQREVAGAQVADAHAHVGRPVAEHAAAAARREPRVDELDGAVELLGERASRGRTRAGRPRRRRSRGTRLRRRRTETRARARRRRPRRASLARRAAPSRARRRRSAASCCAGKYCGTAAMSNDDTVVRRSSSGELSSIGSVSSRLERSDAAGVTTSRSSLTTRTAS